MRHADHVKLKPAVGMRFRQRGKLRSFHADVGTGAVSFYSCPVGSISDMRRQMCTYGLFKAYVRHHPAAKECGHTQMCAIEKLVWDNKIQRRQIIAKRSHGTDRQNSFHSEHLQCANIRAIIYLTWRKTMAASVPSQECYAPAFKSADDYRVRRIAERGLQANFPRVGDSRHSIESASAYNSDANRFLRAFISFPFRRSRHSIYP